MSDIEHASLPDELLHEPKGVAHAATKTVYVAKGNGSGDWRRIKPEDLSLVTTSIARGYYTDPDTTVEVDSSLLSQAADGTLENIETDILPIGVVNKLNKNTAELDRIYNNQKQINEEVVKALTTLNRNFEALYQYLVSNGFAK